MANINKLDFNDAGKKRLHEALGLLGYDNAKQPHYRSNLINAISMFAGLHGDADLESACECAIECIRAEVEQQRHN